MPDKQATTFTVALTDKDWDRELGAWRCPVLKIPGARVEDVLVAGSSANFSYYEVNYGLGTVRWARPKPPERATVVIKLTEELSTRELTLRWKKLAVIVPVITALLGGVISYVSTSGHRSDGNVNAPPTSMACDEKVKITVPVDMQTVPIVDEIKGTFQGLPPGHRIWTMVYPPSIGKYYPQNEAEISGNMWSSRVTIGLNGEGGRTFLIYAVAADEKAHTELSIYARRARESNDSPGLRDLPEGARACQFIRVIRK
jgi:hypothetical protein